MQSVRCSCTMLPALLLASSLQLHAGPDWLVDPSPYKARIDQDAATKELVLDNGLIRRVLLLAPNAATISLENRMTGQELVRSVRPEATIVLGGQTFAIGGLDGQPVHNYLDRRWLSNLTAAAGAYLFERATTGPTQAPFPWKKRLEWMPQDLPWPPPGRRVTLEFRPPDAPPANLAGPVLFEDRFQGTLDAAWKTHVTPAHPRASFANEGKTGEIMAPPNTCVFVERALPAGAVTIEVTADAGDDTQANSWGPGLALLAGGQPLVSLVMRPNSQQYEVAFGGASERQVGRFDRAKPASLRIRIVNGEAVLSASQPDGTPTELGRAKLAKQPDRIRIGKIGRCGLGEDLSTAKADPQELPPRCHIVSVTVRGAEPAGKPVARTDLPCVDVHYEIYDGLPVIAKWLTVRNTTTADVRVAKFTSEILAVVEPESIVDDTPRWMQPDLIVETDYTFGGMSGPNHGVAVNWISDPLFATQVNYARRTPCLLECRPPIGPDQVLAPGGTLTTFRTFELTPDSSERERRTLALRRMYRTLAPWVTENPILMHVIASDDTRVRNAIDQAAECGFEMVIMSFGSGFNFESRDPAYQQRIKALADYARSKKIALGGYSLLASRGAGNAADNTKGVPARFGVMPCLGADWGVAYLAQLRSFMAAAGLGVLEHDGSYPGDACAATNHPGHRGLDDSQWVMWQAITELYQWCRANGVYLNIPDWYFLNGATKTGMGYRETNWSLPREYQEIIERQNIFDGTWEKTPSMGWMFVPLTQYHGGGAAATIEPLDEHRDHYGRRMANLFGAGVQACYRGPRLYDTDATKAVVKQWVDFYKAHRAILDSDLLHLRRADGRDIDYILHANAALQECGLLMAYNPLETDAKRTLTIPLHLAGLTGTALVRVGDAPPRRITLDPRDQATFDVTVPAHGHLAVIFAKP